MKIKLPSPRGEIQYDTQLGQAKSVLPRREESNQSGYYSFTSSALSINKSQHRYRSLPCWDIVVGTSIKVGAGVAVYGYVELMPRADFSVQVLLSLLSWKA